jgi:hypothetical protein
MANTTARTWAIKEAVQARLQQILIVNDYRTDAGADVRLEESQLAPTAPVITIYTSSTVRPDGAQRNQREFTLVIEAEVPTALDNAAFLADSIAEDVEDALDGFVPMPNALPLSFSESIFLPSPKGVAATVAQLMFTTEFRR